MNSALYGGWVSGKAIPLPRNLLVEVTSFCNLRCIMCPKTNHSVPTEESRVMSWEVYEKLFPLFPSLDAMDLTGVWGEAFLHPDVYVRMLERAKQDGVSVCTTSNGTLIRDEVAEQIVEKGLDRLIISLDAATAETYGAIRPPGRHGDVLDGMRRIGEWKKKKNRDNPAIEIAFVGMRSNIEEFPAVVRLAGELGAWRVHLQAMGEYPGLENESVAAHDKARGRRVYTEAKKIGEQRNVDVSLFPPDQFEDNRGDLNEIADPTGMRKDCRDLWTRALIAATGDVLPCCASQQSMGNLNQSSFEEIWYGEGYRTLRRMMLTDHPPGMCRTCTGIAWVDYSLRRDFNYFHPLIKGHATGAVKERLHRVPAARWVKDRSDEARGRRPPAR
jgi:radical SAM protein with 4Fe4S-binding SPASM domain